MARILIVDDEPAMRRVLSSLLAGGDHAALEARDLATARKLLSTELVDVVLTDQKLPDGEGLGLLDAVAGADSTIPVVVITAYASVDLAVEAMRRGAFDFLPKPFQPDNVLTVVRKACEHRALQRENERLRDEMRRLGAMDGLVGDSPAMQLVRQQIERVAPTDATVLISGETGTGKELVARAIHQGSPRREQPFVPINCAALSESLLESELFGHEKGAFTGADRPRPGLFETAHGGTLFLDEAGEMPNGLQAKLLRVLMDGEVLRVGARAARKVDVRVLAATHRDLAQRVKDGEFRQDLYYRLAVIPLEIPPLRARREDLPALVEHFSRRVAADLKMPHRQIAQGAVDKLAAYGFPGNVRELRNIIERAYILARGDTLDAPDFMIPAEDFAVGACGASPPCIDVPQWWRELLPRDGSLRDVLGQIEATLIRRALDDADGVQAEAARRLGVSKSDLNYKLRKLDQRSG
jgi:DNA-binding NtrC family response regulator